jgi:hypothetical protein|tara:strand:+ start:543 stop:803 length:261 start_codon:yes stop_codon:yes gene_type:complete
MSQVVFVDGYEIALLGVIDVWENARAVYSKQAMVNILEQEGMDYCEALQHLEFNVWGAYIGEHTPLYVHDLHGKTQQEISDYLIDF